VDITPADARALMDDALAIGLAEVRARHGDRWEIGRNDGAPGWCATRVTSGAQHYVTARTLDDLDRELNVLPTE
jgi:hypothetical protein